MKICDAEVGDSIFLACGKEKEINKILSQARDKIAKDLKIIDENKYAFCWIVDYPMYEFDENSKKDNIQPQPFFNATRKFERIKL